MKKIATVTLGAAAALALAAGPAVAGPGDYEAPADGNCVSNGVQAVTSTPELGLGPGVSGAAKAGLVKTVILDHAFNNADATEALLGLGEDAICD